MARRHPFAFILLALPIWIVLFLVLESAAAALVGFLGLPVGERLTEAIRFFFYEVPKVILLLILVVFVVGIVRSFFSPERTRKILESKPLIVRNVLASLLGVVTPFCSCSAVPLFIGFVKGGIPLGATFSFLIAAPMINEVALVLLFTLFGWKTAFLYLSTGLGIAITTGVIVGRLRLERFVEEWVYNGPTQSASTLESVQNLDERANVGFDAVIDVVKTVWLSLIAGIGVGAWIHGYVPDGFLTAIMGTSAWWSVPAAVLLGVPLYSNAAGIIPIVPALLSKGVSLGTALAFMMSVIGLSLPEVIILRKVLKPPLIFAFVGVVAVGITAVGYLFNIVF
jgi:hypothetical protein